MTAILLRLYDTIVLKRPLVTLFIALAIIGAFASQIPKFQLDASGDSLVLENDADLHYYRRMVKRYGTNDVLVLTYTAKEDLFSNSTLADLKQLRDELRQLDGVQSVTTILDIPLLLSTGMSLREVRDSKNIKTLENSSVDKQTILTEISENPLYRGRLLSSDKKTTALLVNLPADKTYQTLVQRRYELREKKYNNELMAVEADELEEVSEQYRLRLTALIQEEKQLVAAVRDIMDRHQSQAVIYLGGVPMIVADMIEFIRSDLLIFGVGVIVFLVLTLTIIFRKPRWVLLPLFCCGASVLTMLGYLGMMDWRVTVISSNFVSLMLILTMALTIHLTERYLEVHAASPEADQRTLVLETVRTIALPCLYTTLTTIAAFVSLLVSGIRPVMDFGIMMVVGLIVAFVIAIVLFPASVVLLKKDDAGTGEDFSNPFTLGFARLIEAHGNKILFLCVVLMALSGVGITRLRVENRFIDYFREKTAIFQGMSLIDRKLGGTTPLDLIVDFEVAENLADDFDEFDEFPGEEEAAPWFADSLIMEEIEDIHDYLDGLPETGEVLSLATGGKLADKLNGNIPLESFELAILYKKIPPDLKKMLVAPYVAEEPTQARFTMRIVESDQRMERGAFLQHIRDDLQDKFGLGAEQIRFTNMFVLYNNMLQSLFRSQILTIGVVLLGIMVMFMILFRSLYLAVIGIIPNILPVTVVLGAMGWFDVPLDMMTITIASITIGISVDDTIHYIHRFQREFPLDRNYLATVYRCHRSIGRALYYTTVAITIGFSILMLSNFIPTIYFGLFTGFAMLVALMGDLLLLPQLILVLKPLGKEEEGR